MSTLQPERTKRHATTNVFYLISYKTTSMQVQQQVGVCVDITVLCKGQLFILFLYILTFLLHFLTLSLDHNFLTTLFV